VGIQSVRRDSLRSQIIRQMMELIASGQFAPSECLPPERELALQFDVSRAAVREAIGILSAQGFLEVRHGSGTYVNPVSAWNTLDPTFLLLQSEKAAIIELLEVRESLEPDIAFWAAQRATEADIAQLEQQLQADSTSTVERHVEMDTAFHQLLVQACHNRVFLVLSNSISELLHESRRRSYTHDGLPRSRYWHAEILRAIKAHDADAAREAMRQHLIQVRGELKQFIERESKLPT
jgi:DNA-binding FadR family transcriptional regulator